LSVSGEEVTIGLGAFGIRVGRGLIGTFGGAAAGAKLGQYFEKKATAGVGKQYEDSKNEQAFVEGRILELEEKVKSAKVITEHKNTKTVQLGSHVVIQNLTRKSSDKESYLIVGSTEADPLNHKISNESPIGHALLEHKSGDVVSATTPSGVLDYKILKIE